MSISGVDAVSGVSGAYRAYFHLNNLLPIRRINFPHQNRYANPLEGGNTTRSWQIGSFYSIFNFLRNNQGIEINKSTEECNLCQERRYICSNGETSDGISTIIPGKQSLLRVQHHEAQHLHQARIKAVQEGKVVVSQYIFLQHSICPECGGTYVSSGQAVTHTLNKQEFQQLIQQTHLSKPTYHPSGSLNNQTPEGKGINIDFYG
ncbi:MAG: hypothetical protein AB1567_10560 [bacterium]